MRMRRLQGWLVALIASANAVAPQASTSTALLCVQPETVPTVAAYGLDLQGWDASCQFSSKIPGIYDVMQRSCNGCCEDVIQITQYPALARMVHRGDVKEGDIVATRRISKQGLFAGDVGLYETSA